MKPYIFTVDEDTETLLRVAEGNRNGKPVCKFIDYHFIPNPEGFYSLGFGHFIENLNEMSNTAFNLVFDSGRLTNTPFGFYERRAGIKNRKLTLKPGLMQEVGDTSKILFPSMQRVDQVMFQVLGVIQQYTEMFTSTSEYLTGRESKGTKTPTAHGTLAIIEQGLVTFAVITKRIFRSLRKELRVISDLNTAYLPDSKEFAVMENEDHIAFPDIKKKDFKGHYHYVPIGDPSFASMQQKRQENIELYSLLKENPLIWGTPGDPKTGQGGTPPNIEAIYELTSDLIDGYSKKNKEKILPPLPPRPKLPEEENAMFMQGDYIAPTQEENIEDHMAVHQAFLFSDYYKDMEYKELLDRHIIETKTMAYQVSVQQARMGRTQGGGNEAPER